MKWILTEVGRIESRQLDRPASTPGMVHLKVGYCGVCRTDAKMWHEGHRDLVLPRVPGHEIMARDDRGRAFAVWPGTACGNCRYCRAGRENLCDTMQILGFHFDGGFSSDVWVSESSLIAVPPDMPAHLVCFAEPVGCVLNAMDKLDLQPGESVIIFGGGTIGLIAALAARANKAVPLVIEKNVDKISKAQSFLRSAQISCMRHPPTGTFDAAINACPDPDACRQSTAKLAKGGRFAFFSGMPRNHPIDTELLNVIHYKEIAVFGVYGLTRRHMSAALAIIGRHPAAFGMLVESIVPPDRLPVILPQVLAGTSFKFILDYTA